MVHKQNADLAVPWRPMLFELLVQLLQLLFETPLGQQPGRAKRADLIVRVDREQTEEDVAEVDVLDPMTVVVGGAKFGRGPPPNPGATRPAGPLVMVAWDGSVPPVWIYQADPVRAEGRASS